MIQNKLVESWLDNQGERRYQPALIQLLIAEGWKVLHNTRHGPLEYGKDVIARNPEGKICALQLKGNPGTRLTKNQARDLIPQFTEAIDVEIPGSYGRTQGERHTTIMVTNGEIEEEARELFDRTAVRVKNPLCPSDDVEYWARGELLSRFSTKVQEIWPATIEGLTESIKIFGEDGYSHLPPDRLAIALTSAIGMVHSKMKASEKDSKITSIFLLTEVLKSRWYASNNHSALFEMTVIAAVFALQFADAQKRLKLVRDYSELALQHANDLIVECEEVDYDPLYNGSISNPMNEIDVFAERARLIAEAAAVLALAGHVAKERKTYLEKLVSGSFLPGSLWGQFVIPSMIVRHWGWRKLNATWLPERSLGALLSVYIAAAKSHRLPNQITNAAPYYRFEEILFVRTNGQIGDQSSVIKDDTRNHMSFGRAIMGMLALRNWKQTCKSLWRSYSKNLHGSVEVPIPNYFSPCLSDEGSTTSQQLYAKEWPDLVNESIEAAISDKVEAFAEMNWLAAAYLCIVPYRAEYNVLMCLDKKLNKTWYHSSHRPSP